MMREEFEERIKARINQDDWEVINEVYTFHPSIKDVGGKDQIAKLYREFGMDFIRAMLPQARAIIKAENWKSGVVRKIEDELGVYQGHRRQLEEEYCQKIADLDRKWNAIHDDLKAELSVYQKRLDRLNGLLPPEEIDQEGRAIS
jgi:hypothetical protein